ncbi:hypothetical protein ACIGO9_12340 [Nocardia asteroides]|uniref:hypothetical protein n=1 Tax=Nocardia asteroides TaxID=1824 RepID=UPI0037CBCC63
MTGPEHHPAVPGDSAIPSAAAAPPENPPQPLAPTRRYDGSYVTYPGDPGYPTAPPLGAPAIRGLGGPAFPAGATAADPFAHAGHSVDSGFRAAPHPGYPTYPGHPGFAGYPQAPVRMPGSVRAAQVLSFVAAGLGVVLIVATGVVAGAEAAGRATAGSLLFLILGGLAFSFPTGGPGVRTAAIVLGALTTLCGLGSAASGLPPSLLGMLIGGAVVILLAQRTAQAWFHRPRLPGGR